MKTGYVDGSALLRVVLEEPIPGVELAEYERLVASEILEIEVARRLDRITLAGLVPVRKSNALRARVRHYLETIDLIEFDRVIFFRSKQSFGVPLGTMDAIHFATALMWRERHLGDPFTLLTHDRELARAARHNGVVTNAVEEG